MRLTEHMRNARSTAYRIVGGALAVMLVATGAATLAPSQAHAADATGTVTDAKIVVASDGKSDKFGDTSETDGLVTLGNSVSFDWTATLNSAKNATFSQTLPAGWAWNVDAVRKSGLENANGAGGYISSFTISGQTLTATVSSNVDETGNLSIEFHGIAANVSRTVVPGTTYAPELTVVDEVGPTVVGLPKALTTVGVNGVGLWVGSTKAQGKGEQDFGNGVVPAASRYFGLHIEIPAEIGNWQSTFTDTPTVVHIDYATSAPLGFTPVIIARNNKVAGETGEITNFDPVKGSFDLVIPRVNTDHIQYTIEFWIPESEVPNLDVAGTKSLVITPTVSKAADAVWTGAGGG